MNKRTKKLIALLLAAVLLAAVFAGCGKAQGAAEPTYDLEAQRAQFTQAAQSRQVEQAEGFTPQTIRVTEGDKLIDVRYPAIDANAGVTAELENYVNGKVADFDQAAADMGAPDAHTGLYTLVITYKPYQVGTGIVGVKFTESAYTGKTDVQSNVQAFVYDLETGRKLELADVFDENQDYLSAVSGVARDYLNRNNIIQKTKNEEKFQEGTKPLAANFSNFVITPDNQITFFFNKNTIAPDVAGPIELCVPLSEFDTVLNPDNRGLLFGKEVAQASPPPEGSDGAAGGPANSDLPQLNLGPEYLPAHSIEGLDLANGKFVALTFDDGPGPYTEKLLDILADNGVKATFFLIGENIGNYPDTVKRELADGHEIANHSWNHAYLTQIGFDDVMNAQYGRTNDKLQEVIGYRATLYRPPGGYMNEELAAQIGREQIMWSVDSNDWRAENKSTDGIMNQIFNTGTLSDGAVVLMHDIHPTSVDAVDTVIKALKNDGYTFVTVSQMMQIAEARGQDMGKYMFYNAHKTAAATPTEGLTYGPDAEEGAPVAA